MVSFRAKEVPKMRPMSERIRFATALLIGAIATGCALNAPRYNTDFDHVETLRSSRSGAVKIGVFTSADSRSERPTIRGSTLASPYGSYAAYVGEALRQEFDDARLLDSSADLEISGTLIRNEVETGISVGSAEIEVRFVARRRGAVVYDRARAARHEWESAFAGFVAIPRAQQEYPHVVKKLLAALIGDSDFQVAIAK